MQLADHGTALGVANPGEMISLFLEKLTRDHVWQEKELPAATGTPVAEIPQRNRAIAIALKKSPSFHIATGTKVVRACDTTIRFFY